MEKIAGKVLHRHPVCLLLLLLVITLPLIAQTSVTANNRECFGEPMASILQVPLSLYTLFVTLVSIIGMVFIGTVGFLLVVVTLLVMIFETLFTGFQFTYVATKMCWSATSNVFSVLVDLYTFYMNYLEWYEGFC